MKKTILILLTLVAFLPLVSFAGPDYFTSYPPQLKAAVERIHQLPEARQLLAKIQQNGPVKLQVNTTLSTQFEAFWEGQSRTIFVTLSNSLGNTIFSIIFELHNALADPKLDSLCHQAALGKIDKETYVESVERMEHQNAFQAITLTEKGITKGVFPLSARNGVTANFEDHYKIQQLAGHSSLIAQQFDFFAPPSKRIAFRGTIPGLAKMSNQERHRLIQQIAFKDSK